MDRGKIVQTDNHLTFDLEKLEDRQLLAANVTEIEPNDVRRFSTEVLFDNSDGQANLVGEISGRRECDFFAFVSTIHRCAAPFGVRHIIHSSFNGSDQL